MQIEKEESRKSWITKELIDLINEQIRYKNANTEQSTKPAET